MFKFNFAKDDGGEDRCDNSNKSDLNWAPATKVEISLSQAEQKYDPDDYTENEVFRNCTFKLIKSDKVLQNLLQENSQNIIEAESQHSDLVPAKYEGGLKIWECSYDLGEFIVDNNIELKDKFVLDLGCGVGAIGLLSLSKGSHVHFQDYNVEVIKSLTIPNVLLNSEDPKEILKRCEFYCGDWESFTTLISSNDNTNMKYDLIFTCETIYNADNHRKLYEVFKNKLQENGVGLIAGKTYYFGVGGGMRQFEKLIKDDGFFNVEVVWKNHEGLQREILRLTRKQLRD